MLGLLSVVMLKAGDADCSKNSPTSLVISSSCCSPLLSTSSPFEDTTSLPILGSVRDCLAP